MENKLKEYKVEFLSHEEEINNIQQSQKIKSDYDYFEQVIERSKTCDFEFRLILTENTTHGFFLQALSNNLFSVSEVDLRKLLDLFTITENIFEVEDMYKRVELIVDWKPVLEYYSGVNLYNHLSDLIGCSTTVEMIEEEIGIRTAYNSVYN